MRILGRLIEFVLILALLLGLLFVGKRYGNRILALIAPEDAAFISCNKELNTVIGFAPGSSARLHSAKYDANGNLVNYRINYVNREEYYLKGTPGDGYVYKLMLWGHESQGMQPLCEVVTAEK